MKVSFCEHNKASGSVRDFLKENYPQIDTSLNNCIGECGSCGGEYIVRVNGKLVISDTEEDIIEQIMKMYL